MPGKEIKYLLIHSIKAFFVADEICIFVQIYLNIYHQYLLQQTMFVFCIILNRYFYLYMCLSTVNVHWV